MERGYPTYIADVWQGLDAAVSDAEAQGPAACAARSRLQLALHAQRTTGLLHVARSAPGRDTRSGQGALARRHTDGPLCAVLLKTTVMCEA